MEDLGKGLRSQVGTMFATKAKGPRYLEMAEGYVTRVALNKHDEIIGYEFINLGKMMDVIKKGDEPAKAACEKAKGHLRPVRQRREVHRPASGIRRRSAPWLCLKVTKEESTRSTAFLRSMASAPWRSAASMCKAKGFDPYEIVKGIQPICFENACWAYTVGAAIALKKGVKTAAEAARGHRR